MQSAHTVKVQMDLEILLQATYFSVEWSHTHSKSLPVCTVYWESFTEIKFRKSCEVDSIRENFNLQMLAPF